MQDFRVQSGLQTSGNAYGINYLTASNVTVTFSGYFGNLKVTGNVNTGNLIASEKIIADDIVVDTGTINGNLIVSGNLVVAGNTFQNSLAELRAALTAPVTNVLYVTGGGNDANDGLTYANALANIHTALARANAWTTVFVKSGDYILYNQPVTIPARVGLVGDNLRTTTIRPSQPNVDMFYVKNACYVTGFTFRDHVAPAAVFSFNPDGSAGTIVTSPYIQNCSSITTTGTGMRVDGNYVTGLRSMVCDAYTQTNAGGIGIHMLNRGYTQLVSVFTICCDIAILCEDGGFCSITNSNSSFGNYGLVARGFSPTLYAAKINSVIDVENNEQRVIAYNLTQRPSYGDIFVIASYDQAKCLRDSKLIVDALAFDLAYQSNSQSTFAGLQYWAQATSAVPNQAEETIAAFQYAKNLATNVMANVTITGAELTQTNIIQVFSAGETLVSLVGVETQALANGFDLVANIITGGTTGITDRIIPNSFPANSDIALNNSANLLIANKNFIANSTIAFVNQTYPGFFSNASNFLDPANAITKCERDTNYLLDSIHFDLLHGGNRQAIQSGVYYYQFSTTSTQINDQIVQTGAAYDFIGTIADEIIRNIALANVNQTIVAQNTTGTANATLVEANLISNNIALIKNIVVNGSNVAHVKQPIAFTNLSSNANVKNAAVNLLKNRDFIAQEVVAYVNNNWAELSNGTVSFFTVANASPLANTSGYSNIWANVSFITPLEVVTFTPNANSSINFHQGSYISASGHTFEYVGSGTNLATALPYAGGYPIAGNQVIMQKGGQVYITSTDQQGDFRIGSGLLFNRVDGTITGRTFDKSLFAVMTPYILAIEG